MTAADKKREAHDVIQFLSLSLNTNFSEEQSSSRFFFSRILEREEKKMRRYSKAFDTELGTDEAETPQGFPSGGAVEMSSMFTVKEMKKIPPPPPPKPKAFNMKKVGSRGEKDKATTPTPRFPGRKNAPLPPPPPTFSNRTARLGGQSVSTPTPSADAATRTRTGGMTPKDPRHRLSGGYLRRQAFDIESGTGDDVDTDPKGKVIFDSTKKKRRCPAPCCFVCDQTCNHRKKSIRYTSRTCCGLLCLLILAYLIYATVIIVELLKFSECDSTTRDPPCFEMDRLEFFDLQTNEIPYEMSASLDLPISSSIKVDLGTIDIVIRNNSGSILAQTSAAPQFDGSSTLRGGASTMYVGSSAAVPPGEGEESLSWVLGKILNFIDMQIQFSATVPFSTDAFLFPISSDFAFEAPLSCGYLYTSQYESWAAAKAAGVSGECAESWSVEDKQDSGCSYFCQMDEFPIVDAGNEASGARNGEAELNETVVVNSMEIWQNGTDSTMITTISMSLEMGDDFAMVLHIPKLSMDVYATSEAADPFGPSSPDVLESEERLLDAWTEDFVVNKSCAIDFHAAVRGPASDPQNISTWQIARGQELVLNGVYQDAIYFYVKGSADADMSIFSNRVLAGMSAIRFKLSFDEEVSGGNELDSSQTSSANVVELRQIAPIGWMNNTISVLTGVRLDLAFGLFGTVPPITWDIFSDAGRMLSVSIPTFHVPYASYPDDMWPNGQNVSALVQVYGKEPTHDLWGTFDLLTCGRPKNGTRGNKYDPFDIGLHVAPSEDVQDPSSPNFEILSALLGGISFDFVKSVNGTDQICMNNNYRCFDVGNVFSSNSTNAEGQLIAEQGDIIEALDLNISTTTENVKILLQTVFGERVLEGEALGFEIFFGDLLLQLSHGREADPMAEFLFEGFVIGNNLTVKSLDYLFRVPDRAYGDRFGQFFEDLSDAVAASREDASAVPFTINGHLGLPSNWAEVTALSWHIPYDCAYETQFMCESEADSARLDYPVHPGSRDIPLPGETLRVLVECLVANDGTPIPLTETCRSAIDPGASAFNDIHTDDILRAVRGGWNTTSIFDSINHTSPCSNFTSIIDDGSTSGSSAAGEAESVLRSLDIVGSDTIGGEIVIPCVLDMMCPDSTDDIDLSNRSFMGRAEMSVGAAAKNMGVGNLTITIPRLAFEVGFSSLGLGSLDVFTEFATASIAPISIASESTQSIEELTPLYATLTLDNIWLLHGIINRFMGAYDSRIRVRGARIGGSVDDATLLSDILHRVSVQGDIATTADQFDDQGNPVAVGETVDAPNFWFPTQCQGSWDVFSSTQSAISTRIQVPTVQNLTGGSMSLPVDLFMRNIQISAIYESVTVATIVPDFWGTDLIIYKNGTSPEMAILQLRGEDAAPFYPCSDDVVVKPGNENMCAISEFLRSLVDGALSEPLFGVDAENTFFDFSVRADFTNAVTGLPQIVSIDMRLFDEPTQQGVTDVCVHDCNDFNALEPHFSATECDDADFAISGFATAFFSAIGALMGISDLTISLAIRLDNIFAFGLSLDYLTVSIYFDDPDGVDSWLLGTYPSGYDLPLVTDVGVTVSPAYSLNPGERRFSDSIPVNLGTISGELFARLYDEIVNKGRLCIHLMLSLDIEIADKFGAADFAMTLPLEIKHLSVIGEQDCTNTGACVPALTEVVDVTSFTSNWRFNGDAKASGNTVVLNSYDSLSWWEVRATRGSAWYTGGGTGTLNGKVFVENSFSVSCKFRVNNKALLAADGLAFVIQNSGLGALGSAGSPGHGLDGIGNSVGLVMDVWLSNEFSIVFDGNPGSDDWSLTSACDCDDEAWHTMIIDYNHITMIMSVYIDDTTRTDSKHDEQVDLKSRLGLSDGFAYIGFTASGGSVNQAEFIIDEFTYSTTMTDITQTIFVGSGMIAAELVSGTATGQFSIISRTSCGVEQRKGLDNWAIQLECSNNAACPSTRVGVIMPIQDNRDGTYDVSFSVTSAGTWNVFVSLTDHPEQGEHNIGYFLVREP